MNNKIKTLFDEIGGRFPINRIMKSFYDKVYDDPWLGPYFKDIKREIIESQQGDFIQRSLGGGPVYSGKLPIPAHSNMFITEELYNLRHKYLEEAIREEGFPTHVIEKWLRIDDSFRDGLIKEKVSDCEKRFFTDPILAFDKNGNDIS